MLLQIPDASAHQHPSPFYVDQASEAIPGLREAMGVSVVYERKSKLQRNSSGLKYIDLPRNPSITVPDIVSHRS